MTQLLLSSSFQSPFTNFPPRPYPSFFHSQNQFLHQNATKLHHITRRSLLIHASGPGAVSMLEGDQPEEKILKEKKILSSDEVVNRKPKFFPGRKGGLFDWAAAGWMATVHLNCLFAPFYFTWPAFWVAVSLYVITGLFGMTLSYHRQLSHKSFKLPKWLEYLFAYCGVLALQGTPIDWVSAHRYHHRCTDTKGDPHSPIDGFWYSHMNWVFDPNNVTEMCDGPSNGKDLEEQPFYRFLQRTSSLHGLALSALLYALGGLPFVVWGVGVRVVWVYHITWLVNSACHSWGNQAWNTNDLSRNNWWVALLSFGEGWHNNHHAFEFSARHGLEWWQLDLTWYVVRFLQATGLATDVKLPNEIQKKQMAFGG